MKSAFEREIHNQRNNWFNWSPIAFGIGIGLYFAQPNEPSIIIYFCLGLFSFCLLGISIVSQNVARVFTIALSIFCLGFIIAGFRAHQLTAPILKYRFYGDIEGRVIAIDKSNSNNLRVTLDNVKMGRISRAHTPERIRLSLMSNVKKNLLYPGVTIKTIGFMMPPQSPVEPTGFDFRRHAWFLKLGAIGYSRKQVVIEPPIENDFDLTFFKYRSKLSARIERKISNKTSGFAIAIMTGDRSVLNQEDINALRRSNLAHLLAISGLHMGLLVGVVFTALRWTLTLCPISLIQVHAKKNAAIGAFVFATLYLGLSGFNIATQRAFLMVSLMLCAILINRRAISLRAVALAAWIILFLRPESLLSPGFQMSFAATIALVYSFQHINRHRLSKTKRWFSPISTVVFTSLIAGIATGPIGAAYFNQVSHFGLLANILSVPVMGILVAPGAIVSVVLMPFGAEALGLWVVEIGLNWILTVAHFFSNQKNAVSGIVTPETWVLTLLVLSFLQFILWNGYLRCLGLVGVLISSMSWYQTSRPDILIADHGTLVGVLTEEGRALSKPKGAGFVAKIWLENDGEKTTQNVAHERWKNQKYPLVYHHWSKKSAEKEVRCNQNEIHISIVPQSITGKCIIFLKEQLEKTGAIAIWRYPDGKIEKMETSLFPNKNRLWSPPRWVHKY